LTINRRNFLLSLGASAALPALAPASHGARPAANSGGPRASVDLNGTWERLVEQAHYDSISVPSSNRPIGQSVLKREFTLPKLAPGKRAFLHFEAINYYGRISVNGVALGAMGPYTPYEFEFSSHAREGANSVSLDLADLVPFADGSGTDAIALGVNPGWEASSGIIRDVYVEIRPATIIDNVRLGYELTEDFAKARCTAQVMTSSAAPVRAEVTLRLFRNQVEVDQAEAARVSQTAKLPAGAETVEFTFDVENPALWSPSAPNLYRLEASLKSADAADTWVCRTGFREFKAAGREFRLNGDRCILHGVCRHDMWKDQGFTLTRAQQRQDMRMIKDLGCNFVRLVHYPHDRHIVELADEIGLMVSEEPGYWQVDFRTAPRSEIELGYEILERTIRRDWNSPSVVAWLLANECSLTTEFLKEGKRRSNAIDPLHRLVSAANDRGAAATKPMFEEAGMDFFDRHLYTFNVAEFEKEADLYGPSKPLTFTEWGGRAIGQGLPEMQDTVNMLLKLEHEGKVAGTSFWSWQDLRQYTRDDPEMHDGILESGAVTESREPRPAVYAELKRLFEGRPQFAPVEPRPKMLPLRRTPWATRSTLTPVPLDGALAANVAAWNAFEAAMEKYWPTVRADDQWARTGSKFELWRQSAEDEVRLAGAPFRPALVERHVRPLVAGNRFELEIPIAQRSTRLHILGGISLPLGYPIIGKTGEFAATYELFFANGKLTEIPLRWGFEVVEGNMIHDGTRILPVAAEAQAAIEYIKDAAREQYQILLYSTPRFEAETIAALRCKVADVRNWIAIFAITTEKE
jgi:beta-glucuronidase